MTATRHYAYATTAEPVILIQEFTRDGGGETYTGVDVTLPDPPPDSAAMDEILWVGGWVRVGPWDTDSGRHIARVMRREHGRTEEPS